MKFPSPIHLVWRLAQQNHNNFFCFQSYRSEILLCSRKNTYTYSDICISKRSFFELFSCCRGEREKFNKLDRNTYWRIKVPSWFTVVKFSFPIINAVVLPRCGINTKSFYELLLLLLRRCCSLPVLNENESFLFRTAGCTMMVFDFALNSDNDCIHEVYL